jgi:hypothetical protein
MTCAVWPTVAEPAGKVPLYAFVKSVVLTTDTPSMVAETVLWFEPVGAR